jgi:hypothetical protein
MRLAASFLLITIFIAQSRPALADSAQAQAASAPRVTDHAPGIPSALPLGPVLRAGATYTTINGEVSATIDISFTSDVPVSTPLTCAVQASVGAYPDTYGYAVKSILATRKSASAASCTVTLPYVFHFVTTPLTGQYLYIDYDVSYGQTIENVLTGVAGYYAGGFPAQTVPGNGSVVKESAAITL